MAKKKIEIQTETGVVSMVGFRSADRQTVLYATGGGVSLGAAFRVNIEEGEFSVYQDSFSKALVGKQFTYSFEGVEDNTRSPIGVKFIEFVE